MSGIGRPRTSSFAEPPGVPGIAAATAGSAAVLVGSTGKSGVPQASGGTSSGCSNVKLASKLCSLCLWYFYLLKYKHMPVLLNNRYSHMLVVLVRMLILATAFGCPSFDVFPFTCGSFSNTLSLISPTDIQTKETMLIFILTFKSGLVRFHCVISKPGSVFLCCQSTFMHIFGCLMFGSVWVRRLWRGQMVRFHQGQSSRKDLAAGGRHPEGSSEARRACRDGMMLSLSDMELLMYLM